MYPETFEGFQVDSAETWTTFTKRDVSFPPTLNQLFRLNSKLENALQY